MAVVTYSQLSGRGARYPGCSLVIPPSGTGSYTVGILDGQLKHVLKNEVPKLQLVSRTREEKIEYHLQSHIINP